MLRELDETDKVVGNRLENLCKDTMIGGAIQKLAGGAPHLSVRRHIILLIVYMTMPVCGCADKLLEALL